MTNFQVQKYGELRQSPTGKTFLVGPGGGYPAGSQYLGVVWQDVGQKVNDAQEGMIRFNNFKKNNPTHKYRLIQIMIDE